ncbi:MAG: phosphopantetheine-binding protein [Bryobacteraceae bacterium]
METETIITKFISEELLRGDGEIPPEPNASLISTGILDSLGLLKLLLFIEERFNLKVKDGEVHPSNFETVNQITAFIEAKQKSAAAE